MILFLEKLFLLQDDITTPLYVLLFMFLYVLLFKDCTPRLNFE